MKLLKNEQQVIFSNIYVKHPHKSPNISHLTLSLEPRKTQLCNLFLVHVVVHVIQVLNHVHCDGPSSLGNSDCKKSATTISLITPSHI